MAKLSLCAFSESGNGKSTLILEVLAWIRKNVNPEAKARIATVEHTGTYEDARQKGLVEIWDMNTREKPFETVDHAAHGRWPVDPEDPNSPMEKDLDFETYPLRAFEGISTIADYMGGSYVSGGLAARSGRGDRIGPAEETIRFKDGSREIGGNPRSHYNIVQTDIRGAVANSHKLPAYIVWTAHETKAKDDLSGMPIVGPDVFGLKATQHVSRWFSNLLYLSSRPFEKQVETQVGTKKEKVTVIDNEYFLWLKTHFEPSMPSIPIKAKNSLGARNQAQVPPYLKGGGLAIGEYLDLMVKFGVLKGGQ